jgi:hypothetical protein
MSRFTYQQLVYAGGDRDPSYSWGTTVVGTKTRLKAWVVWLVVLLSTAAIAVLAIGYVSSNYYDMYKSSGAQYDLARAAPNADGIAYYLGRVDDGLVTQNAADGHAALIFKSDANDIGIYRGQLAKLQKRAVLVSTLDTDSVAYQYALTNLRAAVNNLGTVDNGVLWAHLWWAWLIVIVSMTAVVVASIGTFVTASVW